MLLGVVSDTHGDMERTRAAVTMLESLEVGVVLHCGDIGSPEIIPLFERWPTHFVFGNCDYDREALREGDRGRRANVPSAFRHAGIGIACRSPSCTATIRGCCENRPRATAGTCSATATRTSPASSGRARRWCSIPAPCIAPTRIRSPRWNCRRAPFTSCRSEHERQRKRST